MRNLFFLLLLALASACQADVIIGRVVGVIDGDTIDVLDHSKTTHRIRLAGIDAPERRQDFGMRSRQSLSDQVFGKDVRVETYKIDRYKRHVGKVILHDQDVNLEQLRLGMAWFYRQYENELSMVDRRLYDLAEAQARGTKRGLWTDSKATAPWEFRR